MTLGRVDVTMGEGWVNSKECIKGGVTVGKSLKEGGVVRAEQFWSECLQSKRLRG